MEEESDGNGTREGEKGRWVGQVRRQVGWMERK